MSSFLSFRRHCSGWLRRCALALVGTGHLGARYLYRVPENAFESVLMRTFPDLRGLSFIQIGANDGQRVDPLAPFIDAFGWSGLLIEPLPVHFAALQKLRGANPQLRLRQAAVDATAGRRLIYDLRADLPGLPDWTRGLASFDRSRVLQALGELGLPDSCLTAQEVETVSWDDVWREFGAPRCDMLVVDTEGYDITLLRLAGLAARRPTLIHFEHACVSANERFAFYRELTDLGYELATDRGDTTAHLPADRR